VRQTYGEIHPSAAVAHKVRSYKGDASLWMADRCCRSALCRSALVRDKPTERYTPAPRSRTRCAPTRETQACGWRTVVAARLFVGAHLCATNLRRDTPQRRGRAQSALLQGRRKPVDGGPMLPAGSLWERTLCATTLRSGTPQHGCRAQGALPQPSQARGETPVRDARPRPMRSDAPL